MSEETGSILEQLSSLNEQQLRRLLVEHLTRQKLGLYWESNAIERDQAINANLVLPRLIPELSLLGETGAPHRNLIIEGDNFDSLRLLQATHRGKVRVIYIDPPYNTGNKDWVYNDHYVGGSDRWRHSQWLEFLFRRLTLARELLSPDGVILVSINDENRARLELLMDEVFPGRRIGSMVWRTKDSTSRTSNNLSEVHEHILVYGQSSFAFRGAPKTTKKYKNDDNDPRGPWNIDPLTVNADRFERASFFYPLQNPKTGIWYPCDPDRVWAYASESRIKNIDRIRSKSMEQWTRENKIVFPIEERTAVWNTLEEVHAAIASGDIPVTPKRKKPLLTLDTPDLEFWVGKRVGFGRPGFKKHWIDLNSHINPVSSWIARINEEYEDDDCTILRSPQAGEGTEAVQQILGSRAFQYPKPPALMRELLRQATNPGDIVLDFFAGSGTTAQAVLELNAEDGGDRSFILCSSTEATKRDPERNICKDVCAERIRRLAIGKAGNGPLKAHFAYLRLDLVESADITIEATGEHAFQLLSLRETLGAAPFVAGQIQQISKSGDTVVVMCSKVTAEVIEALSKFPAKRIAVYSPRPDTVREHLESRGIEVNSYSLLDALYRGQQTVSQR